MRRASELFDSQPRSPEDEKRKREVGSITCYLEKGGGVEETRGKHSHVSLEESARRSAKETREKKHSRI